MPGPVAHEAALAAVTVTVTVTARWPRPRHLSGGKASGGRLRHENLVAGLWRGSLGKLRAQVAYSLAVAGSSPGGPGGQAGGGRGAEYNHKLSPALRHQPCVKSHVCCEFEHVSIAGTLQLDYRLVHRSFSGWALCRACAVVRNTMIRTAATIHSKPSDWWVHFGVTFNQRESTFVCAAKSAQHGNFTSTRICTLMIVSKIRQIDYPEHDEWGRDTDIDQVLPGNPGQVLVHLACCSEHIRSQVYISADWREQWTRDI